MSSKVIERGSPDHSFLFTHRMIGLLNYFNDFLTEQYFLKTFTAGAICNDGDKIGRNNPKDKDKSVDTETGI